MKGNQMETTLTLRSQPQRIFRDSQAAFQNAIAQGMDNPSEWMYMGTQENLWVDGEMLDAFKHIRTRAYKNYRMEV
jgi:hypothetical protein